MLKDTDSTVGNLVIGCRLTEYAEIRLETGERIRITVVDIKPGYVRLGVEAPKHIRVNRGKVWDEIDRLAAEATKSVVSNESNSRSTDAAGPHDCVSPS